MNNSWKGTIDIKIGDDEYKMRPTFDAMETLTQEIGMSEREAFDKIRSGRASSRLIASIIWAGIMGEAYATNDPSKEVSRRVIGEKMMEFGMPAFRDAAVNFLMFAIMPRHKAVEIMEKFPSEENDPEKKQNTTE